MEIFIPKPLVVEKLSLFEGSLNYALINASWWLEGLMYYRVVSQLEALP